MVDKSPQDPGRAVPGARRSPVRRTAAQRPPRGSERIHERPTEQPSERPQPPDVPPERPRPRRPRRRLRADHLGLRFRRLRRRRVRGLGWRSPHRRRPRRAGAGEHPLQRAVLPGRARLPERERLDPRLCGDALRVRDLRPRHAGRGQHLHRHEPRLVDHAAVPGRQRLLRRGERGAGGDARLPALRRQCLRGQDPDRARLPAEHAGLDRAALLEHPAALHRGRGEHVLGPHRAPAGRWHQGLSEPRPPRPPGSTACSTAGSSACPIRPSSSPTPSLPARSLRRARPHVPTSADERSPSSPRRRTRAPTAGDARTSGPASSCSTVSRRPSARRAGRSSTGSRRRSSRGDRAAHRDHRAGVDASRRRRRHGQRQDRFEAGRRSS